MQNFRIGQTLTVSTTRSIGTQRRVHLVHRCCKTLVARTTLSPASIAVSTASCTREVSTLVPLSSINGFTIPNVFCPDSSTHLIDTFVQHLFNFPTELLEIILLLSLTDKALFFTLKHDTIFHSRHLDDVVECDYALGPMASTILQKDLPRQRIVTAMHASHILPTDAFGHIFTRNSVELLPRMRATFKKYGGVKYLHDIRGSWPELQEHTSAEEIDFAIAMPQTLLLQVHDLGITNIAFDINLTHGRPRWIRETRDAHRIFVHRWRCVFTALTVVSDVSVILSL